MTTVVSCTGCERFIQTSDSECPFCGMERTARATRLRRPHVARAAIVAMALAGGCGTTAPVYGGPPPETTPPAESEEGNSTGEETPDEVDSPEAGEEMEQGVPTPVYGAAPPSSPSE